MEGVVFFALMLGLAFGILQIILFFKLWKATNDIQKITRQQDVLITILQECAHKPQIHENIALQTNIHKSEEEFHIGSLISEKNTGKQWRVKEVYSNSLWCEDGIVEVELPKCEVRIADNTSDIGAAENTPDTNAQEIAKDPLDALSDSEKAKLEEAIQNGRIQDARYILMAKCGMSLSAADDCIQRHKK